MSRKTASAETSSEYGARVLNLADFAHARGSIDSAARPENPSTAEAVAQVVSYDVIAEMKSASLGDAPANDVLDSMESALGDLHRAHSF